jgi:hypothetical protein
MKIRQGFVSNSSSSSFCVFGKSLELDEFNKICKKLKLKEYNTEDDFEDLEGHFPEFEKQTGLKCRYEWESEMFYIGRDYSTLKGKETGEEFRKSVTKILGTGCAHFDDIIDVPD